MSQMEALHVTVHQLQAASTSDRMLSKVFCYTKGSWPYQALANLHLFFTLEMSWWWRRGCLLWGIRIHVIVPQSLQETLLQELYRTMHPGVIRMKSVAHSYMWQSGLDKHFWIWPILYSLLSSEESSMFSPISPTGLAIKTMVGLWWSFQGSMFLNTVDTIPKLLEVRVMSTTTISAILF